MPRVKRTPRPSALAAPVSSSTSFPLAMPRSGGKPTTLQLESSVNQLKVCLMKDSAPTHYQEFWVKLQQLKRANDWDALLVSLKAFIDRTGEHAGIPEHDARLRNSMNNLYDKLVKSASDTNKVLSKG